MNKELVTVETDQPIVNPMGKGERMLVAIQRLQEKKQKLALSREEELPRKKRKEAIGAAKANYRKSLDKFSEKFFGESHDVYGEESEALAELFYVRAKRYVLASSLLLPGSLAGIICLMNIFSNQWVGL